MSARSADNGTSGTAAGNHACLRTKSVEAMSESSERKNTTIVPILSLAHPAEGVAMLCDLFGFKSTGADVDNKYTLTLGNQTILVRSLDQPTGPVSLHHLALAVPDVDTAMNECVKRGAKLADAVTPNGPLEIPEFWQSGFRYVFFEGPENTLIELGMKIDDNTITQNDTNKWSHDHIGIQCQDIAATQSLFTAAGCKLIAEHTLIRPDGNINVAFLGRSAWH